MEMPDLSDVPTSDLVLLMGSCAQSNDLTDKEFAKACRDEIARRKPKSAPQPSKEK